MAEVRVNLANHSYTIHIMAGIISQVGQLMKDMPLSRKALIVTDENVAPLYSGVLADSLAAAGFLPFVLVVPPGESSKSLATADKVFTQAISMGLDRKSPIIALGGGVIGDLSGFVAATYLRGVPFIQVPTTLLAQVDSSVGGKTAVNHPLGKNLIGAFYQPQLVVIDPLVLDTLPERELKAGLAEVVKYGVIADYDFFDYLIRHQEDILARRPDELIEVISRCCQIKAAVVAQDERETSLRMILNFGHTIGHAVEGVGGYSEYNHGEAVAIGMHGAALLSSSLHLCSTAASAAVKQLITGMGLPLTAPGYGTDELLGYLARDKKVVDSKVNWVLMQDVGRVTITQDVSEEHVRAVLSQLTENSNKH
ncbi:3-dehydroquinate synthase [Sporomusa malonica]|uniref:3-dehydroquinate synthase n=1 Tax=Sporomusa malonica TaxID=112901 RepID=A0A1W2EA81_9FIRM|nr:3-dehydroquinate synthase [Sporomusa malonica]SMD06457.1 3-dehydroquinate synthase [Sporomusa malonica]